MDSVRSASDLPSAPPAAKALEQLYRDSYRQLVRLAMLLLGDLQRSEEVVQDVFVDLFQRWDRLADRGNLTGYAKTSVAHAAVSDLRHRRLVQRHRPDPLRDLDSAEVTALARMRRDQVIATIDRLPERQRLGWAARPGLVSPHPSCGRKRRAGSVLRGEPRFPIVQISRWFAERCPFHINVAGSYTKP